MLLDLKTACRVGITVAAIAVACQTASAQLVPHRAAPYRAVGPHPTGPCRSATCGSPLAGPCTPARMTYNYVPVNWRRWPTAQPVDAAPAPEELPTPAKMPEPKGAELPEPRQAPEPAPVPVQPSPAPASPSQMSPAPFGNQPSAPNFDEPRMTPFGDEPQPPPSAADPLAIPQDDEPPMPPAEEEIPSLPQDNFPAGSAPARGNEFPSAPGDSSLPPEMPADDPFKDDPESSLFERPGRDSRLEQAYLQRHRQRTPAASDSEAVPSARVEAPAGPPRLLHANGVSLEARSLPEPPAASADPNPLRQVSHPVRKTSGVQAVETPARQWRRNPLRGE
jgi:hypothetical protein